MTTKLRLLSSLLMLMALTVAGQTDSTKTINMSSQSAEIFAKDSTERQENSPTDITSDRGLYILTKDGNMQLRILGSVRFSVLYDFVDLPVKNAFNTYYIPIGDERKGVPSFNSTLGQSRIGFEVTRKVKDQNVFVRLETDFAGVNDAYRIRHAYGQMGRFLVGQTWSLFSNVSSLPATVDPNGPTGSVTLRTPQIRYSGTTKKGDRWAVALEYSQPDLDNQELDTVGLSTVQVVPDFTARIERAGYLGAVQLSLVASTLSLIDTEDNVSYKFGIGGSLSGSIDFSQDHKLLYQITYGQSISRFITTFSGTGRDAIYNPATGDFDALSSFGGFLSYGKEWKENLVSNFSVGYADLSNRSYEPDTNYNESMSISVDTFWEIIDGARLGVEYAWGRRWNLDGRGGNASRLWALFYYDF